MIPNKELLNYSDENYDRNVEKYFLYDPLNAAKLSKYDFSDYEYCYTHLGELNLCREVRNRTVYYHNMEGAFEEAKQWYRNQNLSDHRVVFLYGLGLGYYYETLKNWLNANPQNRLIFLEDELGVIDRFMATNLATEILDHPQVTIHFLDIYPTTSLQVSIHKSINHLLQGYVREQSFLGSTKLYTKEKEGICFQLRDVIFYISSWYLLVCAEVLAKKSGVLTNHYHNMLRQYRAANGHQFKNLFSGVPAIICGAGPTITQNIDALKELSGEAVIIGSGTGMNVLNHYGIIPHFGVGLDPTNSQGTRIRTNYAYEVPYFYRPRFHKDSFDLLHGPKLYIQGHPHDNFSSWYDEKLGLELEQLPNQGVSSTNFSMQIARIMGCNPIILLGIDLAYVDSSRYPPIISAHPTDSRKDKEEILTQSQVPVYGKNNAGSDIVTKIEWFEEAKTIKSFKVVSPEIQLISCSEESLHIEGVDYLPFSDVRKKYLTMSRDIKNKIHARIIKTTPCVDKELSFEKMNEWHASLAKCTSLLDEMNLKLKKLWEDCKKGEPLGVPPYSGSLALMEEELSEEPAYKDKIVDYIQIVDDMAFDKKIIHRCYMEGGPESLKDSLQLEIDINYISFFHDYLGFRSEHLKEVIDGYVEEEKELCEDHHEGIKTVSELSLDEEGYVREDGYITIDDEEMDIHIHEPFDPQLIPEEMIRLEESDDYVKEIFLEFEGSIDGQYLQYSMDGYLEAELFYKMGELHGPTTHFYSDGVILARSWYINGKKEGKTWQRYSSGALSSLQRYRDGLWDGLQEYYYEDGYLKSQINYKKGILDGEVKLYYSNGRLKRELEFLDGRLHGTERYYSFSGQLIWEAEYSEGTPVGVARLWHSNSQLAREYEYCDDHTRYVMREWDRRGNLIAKEVNLIENLQQENERRQQELMKAVGKFDRDLMHMQYLTKHERGVFIY